MFHKPTGKTEAFISRINQLQFSVAFYIEIWFLYEKQHWTEMDQFVNVIRKIAETATGDVIFLKFSLEYRKTGKYLCQSLFSLKLQVEACNFIKKRDSGTGVFL